MFFDKNFMFYIFEGERVGGVGGGDGLKGFGVFVFAVVDVFFEGVAQLHRRDVVVDFAFDGVGDGPGFFGDDDAYDIELLGDADGAAVAQAKVGVDVGAGGDRKDAAGGEDLVAADDDGPVVER